jgi:tritrans,polycis-undecaprenyl-diphosphate synthase [geranylgeranyl-diphosphate specific]
METENNPTHVAIILDGNRRFAKRLTLEPWKGHVYGRKKVEELIEYSAKYNIKELTFYALSLENLKKRPKEELKFLFKIFKETFKEIDRKKIKENQIRFRFIGNLSLIPEELKEECEKLEKETKRYSNYIVNIAIAYSGRQEILNAIKSIIKNKIKINDINEDAVKRFLYLNDEPDLIIRTGGEKRTSNFLIWQSAYSEWIFLDKMWPEFSENDFKECIEEYKKRKRNFGR